jgi:hypothetical protein
MAIGPVFGLVFDKLGLDCGDGFSSNKISNARVVERDAWGLPAASYRIVALILRGQIKRLHKAAAAPSMVAIADFGRSRVGCISHADVAFPRRMFFIELQAFNVG